MPPASANKDGEEGGVVSLVTIEYSANQGSSSLVPHAHDAITLLACCVFRAKFQFCLVPIMGRTPPDGGRPPFLGLTP